MHSRPHVFFSDSLNVEEAPPENQVLLRERALFAYPVTTENSMGTEIHAIEFVFLLLLLFVVLFGALAEKLKTPYPIVLILAGLLLSFIPAIPRITLNPDVVFLVVLPPLLYAAAWATSWRDFRYNMVSIFFLAFGLVGFPAPLRIASW